MNDRATEADMLFRRGCLQYLEDLGLKKNKKKRKNGIITTKFPHRWPVIWLLVSQLPRQDVQLGKQHDGREQDIHSLAAKEN